MSRSWTLFALLGWLAGVFSADTARAQGPLTNGWTHTALIGVGGEVDSWTFDANIRDTIVIRVGEITQTNNFTPRVRLMNPLGTLQVVDSGPVVVGIAATATNTGTFTVMIDGVAANATGGYRVTLLKAPGAITVAPGDEGGPLTNGVTHTGNIDVGDVDVWTFSANAGDNLTLRMGELTAGSTLTPGLWIYGPNGAQLDFFGSSTAAAEVSVRATNSGTFTVAVADFNAGASYAGIDGYRLTLAKTGSPVVISPGDEGGPLTNGFTHTGNIDAGDIDVWTFTANAGDNIFVAMGESVAGGALTPALWLYGPNGAPLVSYGSSSVAAEINTRATNSGTFTVVAGDFSNGYAGSGAYRLTLVKTGDPIVLSSGDQGGPLTNGVTHTGDIYVGDLDIWNFTASAGENITVRVGELVSGSPLHPAIWLLGPNGAQLDVDNASVIAGEVSVRATNNGTFTVVVGDWNNGYTGSGAYRLTLAKTGSPVVISPGDEGGPMINGATYTGTIDVGDLDVWTFTANAGDSIFVAMGEMTNGLSLTPMLWLLGPNGALLASYDASSVAAEVSARATNSGTFTVVVGDWSNGYSGTGAYRLTMVKSGEPIAVSPGDHGGPLTNAVMHTGELYVGDVDVWNFTATAGENITVRIGEATNASPITPALWLIAPGGAQYPFAQGAIGAEISVRATNSGTFTLVVGDWSNGYAGSGAYRLTLAKTGSPIVISPGDEGGPLVNGATYTGNIDVGDLDVWSFNASAGDSIFVAMGESVPGSSLTPALWFYGPDGRLLASYTASVVASEVYFRATNNGTFTVVAGDWSNGYAGSGAYRLTMVKSGDPIVVSPGDHGGPLTNGVTHTGEIYVGDLDTWHFTASAGENLTLRVGELISGSALHPAIWIFGPTGAQLDVYLASGFAGEVSVRATNSGTFTVVVGDWSNGYAGSGAYRLTLAKTGSPIVISAGDEGGTLINGIMHTGVIDLGDLDVWSFTANAGESIVVRMGETDAGSALTPGLWLYGPDGRLLDSYLASGVASEVAFRATNSGTFTVVAGDSSNAYGGTGAYRLTLAKTGSAVEVSPGDEGGPLNGSDTYEGTLGSGDLDVFYFTLCRGDDIVVRLDEATAGLSLTPLLRLYGREGTLIRSVTGAATAQFSVLATNTGTFLLVLGDFSNGYAGSGAYRLTVNGLSAGVKMCVPSIAGTNVALSGVGGVSGEEFVVLTSPLVESPLATWTPLFTNLFDFYGTFNRTSRFISTEPRRFYIIRQGGGNEPN